MDRLNIFNYFKDKDLSHEDVLTRNFLILIKNIPIVQTAFLELIRDKMPQIGLESVALGKLSVSEVYTQITSNGLLSGKQDYKILSVVISDDEYLKKHEVKESERNARYDGVIVCDQAWLIIIENKPYVGNIWAGQLDPNEEDVKGNELIKDPCCLSWRIIIEFLNSLLQNNMFSLTERSMIEDFLDYVNSEYDWLNPYTNLYLCRDSKRLMDKRCGDILESIFKDTGKNLKYHKGWKYYIDMSEDPVVKQIALDYTDSNIVLWMYGGETMVSARDLYARLKKDRVTTLQSEGFVIKPNFHISFRGTSLVWLKTKEITVSEYINYWSNVDIKQVQHDDIKDYYNELVNNKIIEPEDAYVDDRVISKGYAVFNICPSILFGFEWPIEEAKEADRAGTFIGDVKEKISLIQSAYKDFGIHI